MKDQDAGQDQTITGPIVLPAGMPVILLIDACGNEGSVALSRGGAVIEQVTMPARACAAELVPAMRRMLAHAELTLADVDAVGVTAGPGSFTGMRVGLAIAKGLCEAGGTPLIAISSLEVLARLGEQERSIGSLVAVISAGRGEYFAGIYEGGRMGVESLTSDSELEERLKGRRLKTAAFTLAAALGVEAVRAATASDMLAIVRERLGRREFTDAATLDASYLRHPAVLATKA